MLKWYLSNSHYIFTVNYSTDAWNSCLSDLNVYKQIALSDLNGSAVRNNKVYKSPYVFGCKT